MTNSDRCRIRAARIINQLRASLCDDQVRAAIDDPVDLVFSTLHEAQPASAHNLIEYVAPLIQAVYRRFPGAKRNLSREFARDEAAALVTSCYGQHDGTGFEAAVLDARDAGFSGMDQLCVRIATFLKARLRQQYVDWAFARFLDPSDWETNCNIAERLLESLRNDLPKEAPLLRPEEFVDSIPELFLAVQSADRAASALFADRFNPAP